MELKTQNEGVRGSRRGGGKGEGEKYADKERQRVAQGSNIYSAKKQQQ